MSKQKDILISIVTHGQGRFAHSLLKDIEEKCNPNRVRVIMTMNINETLPFAEYDFSYPITIIKNNRKKGFAANHNHAFALHESNYLCVVNPDIRLIDDPFCRLVDCLKDPADGIVAPLVYSSALEIEDSVRQLPTPGRLFYRFFKRDLEYDLKEGILEVDWAAGMFLFFKASVFEALKGFNEKFFLYCEDIDICSRAWLLGKKVLWANDVRVIHQAQRESRKNLKYLLLHLSSYARIFTSGVYYKRLGQKYRSQQN
jgi:N-acetylglucosaminyl-diphospho-decaprenol L-rhamnosyltransferase